MKTIIFMTACLVMVSASAQTYVKPHVRKDGTYVEGHYRSSPNSTRIDNYGSQGNFNPYTGKNGTIDPYKPELTYPSPNYGQQQCGYTSSGKYVCR